VDGETLAKFASSFASEPDTGTLVSGSARNRFAGIVTEVVKDKVMAQVELQAGRHRVVSLMSREAAEELGLQPGVLATAVVKATAVVIEATEVHR
jgi:molybdopterin-binding protein